MAKSPHGVHGTSKRQVDLPKQRCSFLKCAQLSPFQKNWREHSSSEVRAVSSDNEASRLHLPAPALGAAVNV
eukprot:3065093-Pyramimonas_sp.AAC.2